MILSELTSYVLESMIEMPSCFPVIMGPTASGKSALALDIAEHIGGEIVSVDSMQFYRGLDIGTAKPSKQEREKIPHHLLDIMDINEKSDIFSFYSRINSVVQDICERGKKPVLVGGSGLYLHAFIYGLDLLPQSDSLRQQLNEQYDHDDTISALRNIMMEKCPSDYSRFHHDRRKLIRAYEVFLLTGKEITELQNRRNEKHPRENVCSFILSWDREILKRRIFDRCQEMLLNGWIEETKGLVSAGLLKTPTARQAIGYSIIAEYLCGRIPFHDLAERISTSTWQFARRQITWFNHQHPEARRISLP